ncbi:short chain dehydrogenase [Hirsutella rhossiliensis]|uniref:Short chain dehydrogenase domain-containing protein n=1 Tax=Hirsutella rhossiliensis TaxID=111463 RepID=A0A9P8MTA9_9HYPO|nr:short chain dehydrogenase domain-containing protein [Hirsutella rhossiliensis]KAH0961768.1 short chain dehydrogenase domain-containing protein [Hirsutella rhossiliensis]
MAKVFIVTGASKGIGVAVTRHLLQQSHKVVLAARSQEPLEAIKQSHPGQVEYVAGDMRSSHMPGALTSLALKSFGKLDGIVLNHGLLDPHKIDSSMLDGWKHLYDVNVFSCLAMAKAGIAELRKSRGCIVWVSSGAATKPYTAWAAYGSSKAAVNSISTHLAVEEPDITSVAIAPGRVDTDMQSVIRAAGKEVMDKAQYDNFVDAYQQGKLLKPEQPGHVVAKFVARPRKDLSGNFLNWNSPELAAYQE